MKIQVDAPRCQGTAMCIAVAPGLFALQPNNVVEALVADVSGDSLTEAEDAVLACPTAALSIVENDAE